MNHILLTTNENYAQHCAVCITSLLENNPTLPCNIVVAGLNLNSQTKKKLMSCASLSKLATISIVDFDINKLNQLPKIGLYDKDIYIRLWVHEFFDADVEKVLYLDADTIVVDAIDNIFSLDLLDNVLAAVDIPFADCHDRCHLPKNYDYFNSGVLLFNMKQWRACNSLQKVIDFLQVNKDIAFNPDQDALNGIFYKKRIKLDYCYNAIGPFFRKEFFNELGDIELKRIRDNVVIVHFNGNGAKPWFYTSNHPYQKKYFQYLKMTSWSDYNPEDKNIFNMIKKQLRKLFGIESFVKIKQIKGI